MEEQLKESVWFWLLLGSIMIGQSTWLFLDSGKRGGLKWFWGLWGLIQFPGPLIVYWLVVVLPSRNRKRRERGGQGTDYNGKGVDES
ncbi:sigmaY antisigma factor component [Paenibacillus sp. CAU 1782]